MMTTSFCTASISKWAGVFLFVFCGGLSAFATVPDLNPTSLVQGGDGNFYGVTTGGGTKSQGTVFKMTPSGTLITLALFNGKNGSGPNALAQGSDGNLYGTTVAGGQTSTGVSSNFGTIFRVTPSGALTSLVSFDGPQGLGSAPSGILLRTDGKFYVLDQQNVLDFSPDGTVEISTDFEVNKNYSSRSNIIGPFFLAPTTDGRFFGSETFDDRNVGTDYNPVTNQFEYTNVDVYYTEYTLLAPEGYLNFATYNYRSTGFNYKSDPYFVPTGFKTVIGNDLYFVNSDGIFKKTPSQYGVTPVTSFTGLNVGTPSSGLLQDADGNFYGLTSTGGYRGVGTFYKVSPSGVLTSLRSFTADNQLTPTSFIKGSDGRFYGTSRTGGSSGNGTIFRLSTTGVLTTMASFAFPQQPPQAQALTFPALNPLQVNQSVTLRAKASSGLPVSYRLVSGPANLVGATLTVTAPGSVVVVANQPGDFYYTAAPEKSITIQVKPASQMIAPFRIIPTQSYPSPVVAIVPPVASSKLPVVVTVWSGPATIFGKSVTLTGTGVVTLEANQAGDANYKPAAPVRTSFHVGSAQTITFVALPDTHYRPNPFSLAATASSNLPVAYTVVSGAATITDGNVVTLTGLGEVVIQAAQEGNAVYAPAAPVRRAFQVSKGTQTIKFANIASQKVGAVVELGATATSGLNVTYTTSGPARVSGNLLTVTGAGTIYVGAHQAGSDLYEAAPLVRRSFTAQ